jgi:hypothetical protein
MTSQQFSQYITDPDLLDSHSLELLDDLVMHYPYCQSGQLLLARNYFTEDDSRYSNQLRRAAAHAGDRRMLRELAGRVKKLTIQPQPHPFQPTLAPLSFYGQPELQLAENPARPYEPLTPEELLAIVKKRLAEIDAEKDQEQADAGLSDRTPDQPDTANRIIKPVVPVTKASLIEKFIQDEPRISKPKTAFFNATDSAIRSNFDEEEIVSETLAQLYAQQGNIQKAIHIYEKLSLLNQEKSRFFAAQIEKLSS